MMIEEVINKPNNSDQISSSPKEGSSQEQVSDELKLPFIGNIDEQHAPRAFHFYYSTDD